jgi:hypothetical protein
VKKLKTPTKAPLGRESRGGSIREKIKTEDM